MRKKILFVVIILLVVNPKFVYAGRGCCSHHGGQNYCGSDGYWYCNDGSRSPTCRCSGGSSSNSNNSFSYQKKKYMDVQKKMPIIIIPQPPQMMEVVFKKIMDVPIKKHLIITKKQMLTIILV